MNQSPIKPEQARTDRHVEAFLRALNAVDAPPGGKSAAGANPSSAH